eukprot:TRINITY_DN15705_c0_g1_i1.p1 TRINITY_DN15705_c0_g1~~TRINITY_DN15705_c0_g1_i1.p1  ORF type:complete len:295 (-),score=124.73 TRINITY_DN15705_c0_g1_i1:531-1415(-)
MATVAELKSQLGEYKSQRDEIVKALLTCPGDAELLKLKEELQEVVLLTEELVAQKVAEETAAAIAASAEQELGGGSAPSLGGVSSSGSGVIVLKHAVGDRVEAVWSGDKKWYDAVVDEVDAVRGAYTVTFTGYGNTETVLGPCIRHPTKDVTGAADSVGAKRTREAAKATDQIIPIPESLKVNADDPEEVKRAKKKKLHSIKNKNRFAEKERATNQKKNSWQSFVGAKKSKRKTGFMTSMKKESMFKSPDSVDGKVGVIGSGKGITAIPERRPEYQKKPTIDLPPLAVDDESTE